MFDSVLDLPRDYRSHRIAGMEAGLDPGAELLLADIESPGCIRHWHFSNRLHAEHYRQTVFAVYWDGEKRPSIEVPFADFFGIGHRLWHGLPDVDLRTPLLTIAPTHGFNAHFPMPFARSCRAVLRNDGADRIPAVYWHIDYHTYDRPVGTPLRFHARWRREAPARRWGTPFTILEAKGRGFVAGAMYHVHKLDPVDRWTHGGGDQFFIDGDTRPYFMYDTGGEIFVGGAGGAHPYQSPYMGCHFADPVPRKMTEHAWNQDQGGRWSLYRWFVPDPVAFQSSIRMSFGTLANEISSVAYWYQDEPHYEFVELPPAAQRQHLIELTPGAHDHPLQHPGEIPVAVLGPFPGTVPDPWSGANAVDLEATYPAAADFDFQDRMHGVDPQVGWQRTATRMRFLDVNAIHKPKRAVATDRSRLRPPAATYALVRATADAARSISLLVGHDDGLMVWHDEVLVHESTREAPQDFAEVTISLELRAGTNDIVIRNNTLRPCDWGGWTLSVRLTDPDGIDADLVFDPFDELPPTPEDRQFPFELHPGHRMHKLVSPLP